MSFRLWWVLVLVPAFGCDPITAPHVTKTTIVLSSTPSGSIAGGYDPWISDDGRHVVFISSAANLVPDQPVLETHIYVKNRGNGKVTLVTRNSAQGNVPVSCFPERPFISANGRFVVFLASSRLDNDSQPGFGVLPNVFVRDLELNVTKRAINPSIWPDAPLFSPTISEDGRYVVFATWASNIGMGNPGSQQVYVSDLSTNPPTLTLVSHTNGNAAQVGNNISGECWISADGQTIAYVSNSTDLDPADGDGLADVYVASFTSGVVSDSIVVSRNAADVKADGNCSFCHLSSDGNFVVFTTNAPNMAVGPFNIMLRNLQTNQTSCMTVTKDGLGPDQPCVTPRVCRGGARVAFTSDATNLTGNTSGIVQPYITVPGGGFEQVSVSDTGVLSVQGGDKVSISSAGPWVVWTTTSGSLVTPDPNGDLDVFARGPFRR
jgi:Tol biopolymer transport system component